MEKITEQQNEEIIKQSRQEIEKIIEDGGKITKTIIEEKGKRTEIIKIEPVNGKATSSKMITTKDGIEVSYS